MPRLISLFLWIGLLLVYSGCRPSGDRQSTDRKGWGPTNGSAAATPVRPSPGLSHSGTQPTSRVFLWRASSSSAEVYLLGSIHVARADLYPLDSRIEKAFDSAETLVLEVVLDEAQRAEAGRKLARAGTYPANDGLDRHLGPALFSQVALRAEGSLGSREAVKRFEPWFLSQILVMTELQKLGYDDDAGIDRHFQQQASGRKRIEALETLDEQVSLLDGMPPDLQTLMLEETLSELKDLGPTMASAFDAWKRGDPDALGNLLMKSLDEPRYATLKKRLFGDRNLRMTQAIERMLSARGTWFVVVGSGHLIGEDGIVNSLRRRQFRVEQR